MARAGSWHAVYPVGDEGRAQDELARFRSPEDATTFAARLRCSWHVRPIPDPTAQTARRKIADALDVAGVELEELARRCAEIERAVAASFPLGAYEQWAASLETALVRGVNHGETHPHFWDVVVSASLDLAKRVAPDR